MKKLMLLLFAGTVLFATSCVKTGPQGPQGIQGPAGADGAQVIGEDAFTVNTWTASGNGWIATFSDPNLTTAVYNYGVFEVYKYYTSSGWTNLPDMNGLTSTVFNFRPGYFDIFVYNTDGSATTYPGTVQFRAVVIPSTYKQAHPNTDWTNYNTAIAAQAEAKKTK